MDKLNQELFQVADIYSTNMDLGNYDENSIKIIEEGIGREEYRRDFLSASEESQAIIIRMYGFPLGRCLCNTLNGHWYQDEDGRYMIECEGDRPVYVCPFSMISRFIEYGEEKNLLMIHYAMKVFKQGNISEVDAA